MELPEGVDLVGPRTVFKHETGYSGQYEELGLRDEFRKLQGMYGRIPSNSIEPYEFVNERVATSYGIEPAVSGYTMEMLDIECFLHEAELPEEELVGLVEEVVDAVHSLHRGEKWPTYHGELYHNVAVVEEEDELRPVLMDPAGQACNRFEKKEQKNKDLEHLLELSQELVGSTEIVEERFPLEYYDRFAQPETMASD